ncbi:MAG: T9SS type A sorting domain-containing protein [Candidatus Kapabacteria bacterium]|nr:T9SS type A sorting domain-containing protein [Candidatus Kapabacteria bacterium]
MNIKWVLTVTAAMLLFISGFAKSEPDEVLWRDSNTIYSSRPAVHPNGNVLIGDRDGDVIEFNGLTGEIVRRIPITIPDKVYRIEISKDGTRLLIMGKVFDYITLNVIKSDLQKTSIKFYHPYNNKIIYVKNGYDVAIIDFELGEISSHHFPHTITAHEVSLDGRFLAIACKDFIAEPGNQNTFLYFYNPQTMKSIKDLENTPSTGRIIEFLQFSENSKYVGYGHVSGGEPKATFFSCDPPYAKKEFGVQGIGFIKDEYVFLSSYFNEKSLGIIWDINSEKEIYRTELYSSLLPLYNKTNNTLVLDYLFLEDANQVVRQITSLNLTKILTGVGVDNQKEHQSNFTTEYHKGILIINNYGSITGLINIEIIDIQGNIMYSTVISTNTNNSRIEIPVNLAKSVYILNLQDGKQEYSQKFIVTK